MNQLREQTQRTVTDSTQLREYFTASETPAPLHRVGIEYELLPLRKTGNRPLPYAGKQSIQALLNKMQAFGWTPDGHVDNVLSLKTEFSGARITLEPCGQVELSSAPYQTVHALADHVHHHLRQLQTAAAELGIRLLATGFNPLWPRKALFWIPKSRYQIMRAYMPGVGEHGLDMMSRTCSIQVNLDYADETDFARKYRLALALQPLVAALYANSPFAGGTMSHMHGYRNYVWTRTDADRCGIPAFAFDSEPGYSDYIDYALDVPMYSVQRGDGHIDLTGQSFRRFLDGEMEGIDGEYPTLQDFADHLNTLMPEVRGKRVLELRGADSGPPDVALSLAALWTGLLYDEAARNTLEELTGDWTLSEITALWRQLPEEGLNGRFRGNNTRALLLEILDIACRGLTRRAHKNAQGQDESVYLQPAYDLARNRTQSQTLIELFEENPEAGIESVIDRCELAIAP